MSFLVDAELVELLRLPVLDNLVFPLVPSLVAAHRGADRPAPGYRLARHAAQGGWTLTTLRRRPARRTPPGARPADAVQVRRYLRLLAGLRALRRDAQAGPLLPARARGEHHLACALPGRDRDLGAEEQLVLAIGPAGRRRQRRRCTPEASRNGDQHGGPQGAAPDPGRGPGGGPDLAGRALPSPRRACGRPSAPPSPSRRTPPPPQRRHPAPAGAVSELRQRVIAELAAAGLAPLHRLGQNFMVDGGALSRAGRGPGRGALGQRVWSRSAPAPACSPSACSPPAARVLAVELDRGLHALLQASLVPRGLELVHGDCLASKSVLHPAIAAFAAAGPWRLGANLLPYDVALPALLNAVAAAAPARGHGTP